MNHKQKIENDSSRKIAHARVLIYVPLFLSIISGFVYLYYSISSDESDASGLTNLVNYLISGAMFALSILISIICVTIGLIKLKRAKNNQL